MTKHIDRQRTELLARKQEILNSRPELVAGWHELSKAEQHDRTEELDAQVEQVREIEAALGKLDELTIGGDPRPHPRVKLRKVTGTRAEEIGAEHDGRWLVSVRHEADDEREQVLGTLANLPTAHGAATEYVAVQRFLADRLGGKR